jgi:hypothetical protein
MAHKTRPPEAGDPRRLGNSLDLDSRENTRDHHEVQRVHLTRLAVHLHALGPRATFEFIAELAALYGPAVVDRLEAYGRLDRYMLTLIGGDIFPPEWGPGL